MSTALELVEKKGRRRGIDDLDDEVYRQVKELLEETRKRVLGTVAQTDWQAHHLKELLGGIDEELAKLEKRMSGHLADWQRQAFDLSLAQFDPKLVVEITQRMIKPSSDTLALLQAYGAELVKGVTAEGKKRITDVVARGLLGGSDSFSVMKELGANLKDPSAFTSLFHRAEAITRTETMRAHSESTWLRSEELEKAGIAVDKEWVYAHLAKFPRADHMAISGEKKPREQPFSIGLMYPHDPNAGAAETIMCFPADTRVVGVGVERVFKRYYEGPLVEITTARRHKLAGTPNHPVLTDGGWVGLGLLKKGDHVVSGSLRQEGALPDPDVDNMPALLGEIFDALADTNRRERRRGSTLDFHGDGGEGEVEVVSADSELQRACETSVGKPGSEQALTSSDLRESPLLRESLPGGNVLALRLASGGAMGRGRQGHSLFRSHSSHPESRGLTTAALLDLGLSEDARDTVTRDALLSGDGLLRCSAQIRLGDVIEVELRQPEAPSLPASASHASIVEDSRDGAGRAAVVVRDEAGGHTAQVFLDNVISINVREFRGHVYNLQTSSGIYIANGIVSHNCK